MRQSRSVELNWCGWPIRPGEPYGGRSENIPEGCPPVLGEPGDAPARDRRGGIRGDDVSAGFKGGPPAKNEAARQLGASTGGRPATRYPPLDENGRFATHLCCKNGKLTWR